MQVPDELLPVEEDAEENSGDIGEPMLTADPGGVGETPNFL